MRSNAKGWLVLENGRVFTGFGWGAQRETLCRWVFSTAMGGYVETVTDPAMVGLGCVMTYPLVGNYGCCTEDFASDKPRLSAMAVREIAQLASNFRSQITLDALLTQHDIPGLYGVDTRALVRVLREQGSLRGLMTFDATHITGTGLVASLQRITAFRNENPIQRVSGAAAVYNEGGQRTAAVLDIGLTRGLLRQLTNRGFCVRTFPYDTPAQEMLACKPDLVLVSNGPGAPADCPQVVETAKGIIAAGVPLAGVGLGHLMIASAEGLPIGPVAPRLGSYPVRCTATQRVTIATQGHSHTVTHPGNAHITHENVSDQTIAGLRYMDKPIYTVQFHPEGAPGPLDTLTWFDEITAIKA